MKKSAGIISIIVGIVTGIQIIGQIVVAQIFGARMELDAFVAAVTIPSMLTLIIAGTLNDAFLPLLKKKQLRSENESNIYFIKIMLLLSFIVLIASLLISLFSIPIIEMLFGVRGKPFVLFTNSLMQYLIYTMVFTVVGTFCNSYLYSKGKFTVPSIAYLVGSILNLLIIFITSPYIGIWSMVIGFIGAIIIQLVIVFPYKIGGYVKGALSRIFENNTKSELISLLVVWTPLIISSFAMRFDNILVRSFSARLPEGYIVYVNLVMKLFSGLIGVMTIGLQTVLFPHLVELIQTKNYFKTQTQVNKAKMYSLIISVSVIMIIVFIAPFFMRLLLTGGKFSYKNVDLLISLFPYFIIPAVGWGISQIFFQPIIVIGKQYLLTLVNIGAVLLAWVSATYTYNLYGGMPAISVGLIVLSFTGIIGAEIIWRRELKSLLLSAH